MLQHLQWEQLQYRQDNFCAIIMYKIINNLVDINLSESQLIALLEVPPLQLMQLQTNLDFYKHSFLPHAIRMWNSLPTEVVLSASYP